jgi:lysophospholipase
VRLRVGLWSPKGARGTILLFPGRTEYIEKYGRVIKDLTTHGFAVAVIDWRGQGLSDRIADDPALGHVETFSDYQKDVRALMEAVKDAGLPRPFHLLSHSMGGNIALRAMIDGLDVARAVFSAPMWGIYIPLAQRASAAFLPTWARMTGKMLSYLPGAGAAAYVNESPFEGNLLTTDQDHFEYFSRQVKAVPELGLGGPSVKWFLEAMSECAELRSAPKPSVPSQIYLGEDEGIVDPAAIRTVHADWADSALTMIENARHELMMEHPTARQSFLDGALAFFDKA